MAQRAIREYEGKRVFHTDWSRHFGQFRYTFQAASVASGEELIELAADGGYDWLRQAPLVVKPDMIFGKRGLNGLVLYKVNAPGDVTLEDAVRWIDEKRIRTTTLLSGQSGVLSRFIVEPFVAHDSNAEYYIAAVMGETADILSMSTQGGVNIEDNWGSVSQLEIPPFARDEELTAMIAAAVPGEIFDRDRFVLFATDFYRFFRDQHFAYLEINPFCFDGDRVHLLDLVAKVDDTAGFLMDKRWGPLYFPTPFGMKASGPEEKQIKVMDEKSGASLKLTILNPQGRVWTLVAGGGASVVYADTITDLIGADELANYGEYSGNPTTQETPRVRRNPARFDDACPRSTGARKAADHRRGHRQLHRCRQNLHRHHPGLSEIPRKNALGGRAHLCAPRRPELRSGPAQHAEGGR